jgi:hypothetical protein
MGFDGMGFRDTEREEDERLREEMRWADADAALEAAVSLNRELLAACIGARLQIAALAGLGGRPDLAALFPAMASDALRFLDHVIAKATGAGAAGIATGGAAAKGGGE